MPELSVVIPTRQRDELLLRTLRRLVRQTASAERFEVIVVRDASDAGTSAGEELEWPFALRWLRAGRAGASAARNLGWRAASSPVVLFLGDDILACDRLVSSHLDAHRRHPAHEVGVLGRVGWAREVRPTPFMRWLERGIQFDYASLDQGAEPRWWHFYTANASLKRTLLESVGGFDEDHFPYLYEDLDLAARMSKRGFRVIYAAEAFAEHLHPQTVKEWGERIEVIARAERRFVERHPGSVPYYHRLFTTALRDPARGISARLIGVVPRRTPWLGSRVWASAELRWRRELGERFMSAWESGGGCES